MRMTIPSRVVLIPRNRPNRRSRGNERRLTVRTRPLVLPGASDSMSWPAKIALVITVTIMMTLPYHAAQQWGWRTPIVLPATAVDRWVAFRPGTAWIYWSLFPLALVIPARFRRKQEILRYAAGFSAMAVVSCAVFLAWPTAVPRPVAPASDWAYHMVVSTDRPTNACPSLHASMAVFAGLAATFLWTGDRFGVRRLAVWVWALLILYSTLATRQHVLFDLIAGALLGAIAYAAAYAGFGIKFSAADPNACAQ
jgi:membrane-associated phospholipid phosphatase